jgi:phage gp36-like protein
MGRFLTRDELYSLRGEEEMLRLAANDEARVDSAIGQAEDEAVSYVLSRYGDRLPLTPETTPAVLKTKLAVIAHRRLVRGPQVAPSLVDETTDALTWLSRVARGQASLDLPDVAAQAVDRAAPLILATTRNEDDPPPLSFETLRKW